MRIVLTREAGRNDDLAARLASLGEVVEVPLTETRYLDPVAVAEDLEASCEEGAIASLVVTSARAARYAPLASSRLAPDARVYAVGEATARALASAGVASDVVGAAGAAALAHEVLEEPVLVLGAAHARPELGATLDARGLAWTAVPCYETVALHLDEGARAALASAEVVVVGAPSAWAVARGLVAPDAIVAVPGDTTAEAVRADHARVVVGWEDLVARLAGESGGGPR
jgi:uroporphyrinogen-III synthase